MAFERISAHVAAMSDDPITRLNAALQGRYRVERKLGEGGMATVYLADDLRHERKVALKVLKPELAAVVGAERFLAEIKTTANLQHPHILPLFDSGEAGGFVFYVMPFMEGESLRDRLDRERQLPVADATRIAVDVAEALDYAHGHGVVHRDIKPANILIQAGRPVIADFGIALAVGAAGGGRLTETGLSVGTPHYMSPEQATGDQMVGASTDIYALGCVLYEMLVGEPPYTGGTAQAVLGRIIAGEVVSATKERPTIPAYVDAAIRKALEKVPADRFASASDFGRALEDRGFRYGEAIATAGAPVVARWRTLAISGSIVGVVGLFLAGVSFLSRGPQASEPVSRVEILPFSEGMARPVGGLTALAPDGASMVFAESDPTAQGWQLWLKPRAAREATPLPGTESGQNVTYSPDGQAIAFASGAALKTRPVGDGSTVTLAEDVRAGQVGLAWLDDGTIVYEAADSLAGGSAIVRIPEAGGVPDTVKSMPTDLVNVAFLGALPGSRGVLAGLCINSCAASVQLTVIDFEADTTRLLLDEVLRGWYVPTGHLVYVRRDGAVFIAPFDIQALDLTGPGEPLFDSVMVSVTTPEMVVGGDGTVLYAEGTPPVESPREVVWVDRNGRFEPVDPSLEPDRYQTLALSPEDERLAVTIQVGTNTGNFNTDVAQLWVKELPSGPMTRLTTDPGYTRRPVWSDDGRSITYITLDSDAWPTWHARTVSAEGGAFEVLLQRERLVMEVFFHPDGSGFLFREGDANQGEGDLGFVDLTVDSAKESLLVASEFNERAVSLSPNGRWMAYVSDVSGDQNEVFVRPFPMEGTQRVQVSTDGGLSPVWGHNGTELFFIDGEGWMSVARFNEASGFVVEDRTRLFDASTFYWRNDSWRFFDVTDDDQRFVALRSIDEDVILPPTFVLIRNFFEELKERMEGN